MPLAGSARSASKNVLPSGETARRNASVPNGASSARVEKPVWNRKPRSLAVAFLFRLWIRLPLPPAPVASAVHSAALICARKGCLHRLFHQARSGSAPAARWAWSRSSSRHHRPVGRLHLRPMRATPRAVAGAARPRRSRARHSDPSPPSRLSHLKRRYSGRLRWGWSGGCQIAV